MREVTVQNLINGRRVHFQFRISLIVEVELSPGSIDVDHEISRFPHSERYLVYNVVVSLEQGRTKANRYFINGSAVKIKR